VASTGRTVALLLSRQAGRPSRKDPWVSKAIEAVAWIKEHGLVLLASTGIQTWELLTALGSINNIPLGLVLPIQDKQEFRDCQSDVIEQFDLDPSLVTFYPVSGKEAMSNRKDIMQSRDRMITEMADLIMPLSLRPLGNMSSLLSAAKNRGAEVDKRFLLSHEKQARHNAYSINMKTVNPAIGKLGCSYLTHWTRAVNGKWPEERQIDFYRAIISSERYPRNGCDTLKRIVKSGRILASSKRMPGKVASVSFSSTPPRELIPLMKWRARYHQMSFEPYGIGVPMRLAEMLKIRQVNYFRDKAELEAASAPAWLTQSIGRITDWRPEREFRHLGEFDLTEVPRDELIMFCRFKSEAKKLEDAFGIRTVPFEIS